MFQRVLVIPAWHPNLSAQYYFLWGYLKGRAYREKTNKSTQTQGIHRGRIGPDPTSDVMNRLLNRADFCLRSEEYSIRQVIKII